jgi:hypothetical protein
VRGLDQYAVLYADAKKWYNEGWVDYMTPQLYWSWTAAAAVRPAARVVGAAEHTRSALWPGNYTSKVGFTNSAKWNTDEILEQIRLTRAQPGATGNVHFSSGSFQKDPENLNERLVREAYAIPALVPASTWLPAPAMAVPSAAARIDINTSERVIDLGLGTLSSKLPWLWTVQVRTNDGWTTQIVPGSQRVLGDRRAGKCGAARCACSGRGSRRQFESGESSARFALARL